MEVLILVSRRHTLLKINSLTSIFQLFSNIFTNIYSVEPVSQVIPGSFSYRSMKDYRRSHQMVFFILGFGQLYTFLVLSWPLRKSITILQNIIAQKSKIHYLKKHCIKREETGRLTYQLSWIQSKPQHAYSKDF